ncbi:UxaA family hydrolase [Candidatus Bipolaricaulota bacterium]
MASNRSKGERTAILLHPDDNVVTLLRDRSKGDSVEASLGDRSESLRLDADVRFGHKIAVRRIAEGEDVVKYGMPIGQALEEIEPGTWVHVHNCRSERYGFRQEQYGIHA